MKVMLGKGWDERRAVAFSAAAAGYRGAVTDYLVRIIEDPDDDAYVDLDEAAKMILGAIGGTIFGRGFEDDDESRNVTLLIPAKDLHALKGPLLVTVPEGVEVADITAV